LSPARAFVAADMAQVARSVIVNSAEENFFIVRFIFIENTTVFKIFELRGGGSSNRAAIILINCDFAKPDAEQDGEGVCRMPAKKAQLYELIAAGL